MIDYILAFPDEATAHAALDPMGYGSEGAWDSSRVLPVQIGIGEEEAGTDAETGAPIMRPLFAQGFWLVVSLPTVSEELWQVPACMREADRNAAEAGQLYVLRERFSAEQLAAPWWITPQWCGIVYDNAGA